MSRIFDVIKKTDLIDPVDIAEFDSSSAPATVAQPKPAVGVPGPSPVRIQEIRLLPLRVSALDPVFPFDQNHQRAAEQYRIIRTKILHHARRPKLILLSSAASGDGKTITSINVAASLALKQEASVLLLDADMRRPRVAKMLGLPVGPGLADVLSGRSRLDDVLIRAAQFPNLSILHAGQVAGNPAELLDSRAWRTLVEELRGRFTHVILDATPVGAVADYELIQMVCDGVVVVVRPDHTERKQCLNVLRLVPREKLLGVVLNCVEEWWLWKNPSYGYYYQEEQPSIVKTRPR